MARRTLNSPSPDTAPDGAPDGAPDNRLGNARGNAPASALDRAVAGAAWTHGFVAARGLRLHYVSQGEGPLMLMLHGFPEFWYSWRHQIPALADRYRVVALDLPGYNDSDKPADLDAYRLEALTDTVAEVVRALGYDRCHLVGHDWGGAIAWATADRHPAVVENLVVLNLPHPARMAEGLRSPQQLLRSWYIFFFQLPWLPELVLQLADYRLVGAAFSNMAARPEAFSTADLDAYKDAAAKRGAIAAMLNYYRALLRFDTLNRQWGVLEMPVLLVWGEQDAVLGKELTYGTEQYARDFQIRYLPEAGHWVQQECPDTVNHYIREFLAD